MDVERKEIETESHLRIMADKELVRSVLRAIGGARGRDAGAQHRRRTQPGNGGRTQ